MLNLKFEKTITLGQVVTAMLFIVGTAAAFAVTKSRVEDLDTHRKEDVSTYVTKEEFNATIRGIDNNISDIRIILLAYVTGRTLTPSDLNGPMYPIPEFNAGKRDTSKYYQYPERLQRAGSAVRPRKN